MKEEMNNKNRLKIIFRPFLPETNSSSSHSLVITQGTPYILPGNPLWDVPTDPLTGKLKIAGYASFGRGAGVYNSVYSKIQYTAAALCYWSRTERASHEGLLRLERIIKDITGIPGVTWEWIPDYYKRLFTAYQDPREFMKYGEEEEFGWPDVDHEGTDRFPEVLESDQTIADFIFSPTSVLYTGDDGGSPSVQFFGRTEPKAILHVEIPEPIGRIYLLLYKWPCNVLSEIGDVLGRGPLDSVVFEKGSTPWEYIVRGKDARDRDRILLDNPSGSGPKVEQDQGRFYFAGTNYFNLFRDFPLDEKLYWFSPALPGYVDGIRNANYSLPDAMKDHPDLWLGIPWSVTILELGGIKV